MRALTPAPADKVTRDQREADRSISGQGRAEWEHPVNEESHDTMQSVPSEELDQTRHSPVSAVPRVAQLPGTESAGSGAMGPTGRPLPDFPDPGPLSNHGPARIIAMCNQKGGVGKTLCLTA